MKTSGVDCAVTSTETRTLVAVMLPTEIGIFCAGIKPRYDYTMQQMDYTYTCMKSHDLGQILPQAYVNALVRCWFLLLPYHDYGVEHNHSNEILEIVNINQSNCKASYLFGQEALLSRIKRIGSRFTRTRLLVIVNIF